MAFERACGGQWQAVLFRVFALGRGAPGSGLHVSRSQPHSAKDRKQCLDAAVASPHDSANA